MKSEVYKINVDTREDLLAPTVDAAARTNKRQDQINQQHAIFEHDL
jgi:hypothetical protein